MFARFRGSEMWLTSYPRLPEECQSALRETFAIESLEDRTVPAASDLFVSSIMNDAIVRIDSTGQSIFVSGNNIDSPRQLLFINNYEFFLASFNNDVILRVDNNGSQHVFAALGNIDNPSGMAFDGNGNLVVANFVNNAIVRLDQLGNQTVITTGGNLSGATGLLIDANANIYVGSFFNNQIVKIDAGNNQTVLTTGGDIFGPQQLAFDANGDIVVASLVNDRIVRVDANTGAQTLVSAGGLLSGPTGVVVADNGDILVSNFLADTIIRIDTQGNQSLVSTGNSLQRPGFLTLGPQIPTVTLANGILTIVGTDGDDVIEIDDQIDVTVNNIAFGPFKKVQQIVVLMKGGDDVLRILDPISAPFTINGGDGNDTLDLSDVYGQVTTYVGPNSDADSQFISIENLSTGRTIFMAGADLVGTIDAHGQALDFSRLATPVNILLDSLGHGTVNGTLNVFNVGRVYVPLFQPNVIVRVEHIGPTAVGLDATKAEKSDKALTIGEPNLDDDDTSDDRGERWMTANDAAAASRNGASSSIESESPEAVDAALEEGAIPVAAIDGGT